MIPPRSRNTLPAARPTCLAIHADFFRRPTHPVLPRRQPWLWNDGRLRRLWWNVYVSCSLDPSPLRSLSLLVNLCSDPVMRARSTTVATADGRGMGGYGGYGGYGRGMYGGYGGGMGMGGYYGNRMGMGGMCKPSRLGLARCPRPCVPRNVADFFALFDAPGSVAQTTAVARMATLATRAPATASPAPTPPWTAASAWAATATKRLGRDRRQPSGVCGATSVREVAPACGHPRTRGVAQRFPGGPCKGARADLRFHMPRQDAVAGERSVGCPHSVLEDAARGGAGGARGPDG